MPTLTIERIDVDAAGLALVAEVEDYLRSITPTGPRLDVGRLFTTPAPAVCAHGQVVQPWHASIHRPEPSMLDRLRGRRPVAQVTVRQHLQLVSKYVHAHGWTQGRLWDETGAVCLLGAQIRVVAAGYSTPAVVNEARLRIGNQLGRQGEGMPLDAWNDRPGRRVTDVHQLLQRAAAR